MQFHSMILDESLAYSGRELRSGWVARASGLDGDCGVGFMGPCSVATEDLVDLDDVRAGSYIESALMAHVIMEHPGCPIGTAVLRQRLLVCILAGLLDGRGVPVRRDGDDLFVGNRKLTVSIAAPSSGSSLIHLGVNIDPSGAPVPAIGLEELSVAPRALLSELLSRYGDELHSCAHAETKVRSVP